MFREIPLPIMNTEQTSKNIFTYIKTHYGETSLMKGEVSLETEPT